MPDEITEPPMSNSDAPIDWGAWLDANGARLLLYARQQTPTCADAEDVLQDALLQLVRTVECGEFHGGQEQWLAYTLTAIRHLAADEARRRVTRRNYEASTLPEPMEDNPWLRSRLDDELHRRHVESVLRTMPADYVEVLILKIWEGLTFQQIARVTGENMNTVNSRYRRALCDFRERLDSNPMPE
ncbi:MAG: sigma-70 family RNA polymerase sigma factor [Akkermansia sp.]|nr:sigma-70 family RNA polymerase sigma factor [Akkermansia sp.]